MTTMKKASFLLAALSFVPAAASAQHAQPVRLAAGAAAGLAIPLHGDFGFNAPEWQISIRAAVSDHVLLEGFFDEWRKSTENVLENLPLRGPDAIIGHVDRISLRTQHVTRSVGMNGLLRGQFGRVSLTGGGGVGFMSYRRDYSETTTGCQSTIPSVCQGRENRWTNSSFTLQAAGGVDVALTSRLSGFAQYQMIAPVNDFGSMHVGVIGGVRVGVW